MQRIYIFVLACQVHCAHSYLMDIGVLHDSFALLHSDVAIEDCYGEEVSPCGTFEGSRDFDHPIDHLGAILLANIVRVKWRISHISVTRD